MDKFKNVRLNTHNNTLFLQGVFKKDCMYMEDMLCGKLSIVKDKKIDAAIFDKIPTCYTSLETWPKKTNLKCWTCHRNFNTMPWFEPQAIEPVCVGEAGKYIEVNNLKKLTNEKTYNIPAIGNFCSCNCVQDHIEKNTKDLSEKTNKKIMLKFVYHLIKGKNINEIRPSPSFTLMKVYGGKLSESEYQQKIDMLEENFNKEDINQSYDVYLKALTDESKFYM